MLAPPYLFELAAPLLILNGRVSQLTYSKNGDVEIPHAGRYARIPLGTLEELNDLYLELETDEVKVFKDEFARERRIRARNEISRSRATTNRTLTFIIDELLPELKQDAMYQRARLPRTEIQIPQTGYDASAIRSLKTEIGRRGSQTSDLEALANSIIIGKRIDLLGNRRTYHPISIGERRIYIQETAPKKKYKSIYRGLLKKKLKMQAIDDNAIELSRLAQARRDQSRLANVNQNNYESHGIGFKKSRRGYYVFISTGKFANISPHNSDRFYEFELTPAVEIYEERGQIKVSRPMVIDEKCRNTRTAHHPFVPRHDSDYASFEYPLICLGSYRYDRVLRKPPLDAAVQLLLDSRLTLWEGYSGRGNPHHTLNDENFRHLRLTLQDLRRRGLKIRNLQRVKRYKGANYGPTH